MPVDLPAHVARVVKAKSDQSLLRGTKQIDVDGTKYTQLFVRESDADRIVEFLEFSKTLAQDVARLIEAVSQQSDLIALQAQQIQALRAEVDQARSEERVMKTLEKLQGDATAKGNIKRYEVELAVVTDAEEVGRGESQTNVSRATALKSAGEVAGALGKLHTWVSGASLSGQRSQFDQEKFIAEVDEMWRRASRTQSNIRGKVVFETHAPVAAGTTPANVPEPSKPAP